MTLSILFLILGFALLIKGADFFVDGASALAQRFSVSEIVIGLTVVAFGTSTPELIVNIFAGIEGETDMAFGNVIGSNLANILLILGIAGIIYPIQTEKNTVWREIPFSLLGVLVLIIVCNDLLFNDTSNILSRSDGLILLLFFIIFLVYTFAIPKIEIRDTPLIKPMKGIKIVLFIFLGLSGLIFGGKLVVDNSIKIAMQAGMSEKLIGLTIVAVGTSLPELFTSAIAAYKKKSDIAIGNVVGSNIFNIFFVLSTTSIISPLPFQSVLNFDLVILLVASLILFLTMFSGKKRSLDRWEAFLLLSMYISYIIFLVIRG